METSNNMNSNQQLGSHGKDIHSFFIKTIFYFLVVLVVVLALWFINSKVFIRQSSGYQAIFLSNGQVYFGHTQANLSGQYVRLNDVYYLQINESDQLTGTDTTSTDTTDTTQSEFALIKLGNEIHGPHSSMLINRDHILFIEDLRSDSDLVKSIENYEKQ
ncbi:MAG: hypothetical protein WC495_00445 [Patescibacteria group bacterium]|jgi:hypothetical protein